MINSRPNVKGWPKSNGELVRDQMANIIINNNNVYIGKLWCQSISASASINYFLPNQWWLSNRSMPTKFIQLRISDFVLGMTEERRSENWSNGAHTHTCKIIILELWKCHQINYDNGTLNCETNEISSQHIIYNSKQQF